MSVIHFRDVGKRYRLGSGAGLGEGLRRAWANLRPGGAPAASSSRDDAPDAFWALRHLSFSLEARQTLGLIGANGAGKTTALKLMSRVTWPTEGQLSIAGRVAALIELGAGFHPELTGRENVFLNGAILGMSDGELRREYPRIVAFAELERFMDTPVKRYSSGMFARLGFAVAAHVDPEVLLVDEVLAVGDLAFQRKCHAFIQDFVRSGRSTVFVSHQLYALEQLCDRLIWLEAGRLRRDGPAAEVLAAYLDHQDALLRQVPTAPEGAGEPAGGPKDEGPLRVRAATVLDAAGQAREVFRPGEDLVVALDLEAVEPVERPHLALGIWDGATRQPLILASMLVDGLAPAQLEGPCRLSCRFHAPPLMPRSYQVWGEVYAADRQTLLLRWQLLAAFGLADPQAPGEAGALRHSRADAPVRAAYEWTLS